MIFFPKRNLRRKQNIRFLSPKPTTIYFPSLKNNDRTFTFSFQNYNNTLSIPLQTWTRSTSSWDGTLSLFFSKMPSVDIYVLCLLKRLKLQIFLGKSVDFTSKRKSAHILLINKSQRISSWYTKVSASPVNTQKSAHIQLIHKSQRIPQHPRKSARATQHVTPPLESQHKSSNKKKFSQHHAIMSWSQRKVSTYYATK